MSTENEFVAKEIAHSGFPLEIEVADHLEARDWEVYPSDFYFDYVEESFKEIDVLAEKDFSKPDREMPYLIKMILIVECKKREETALVFFPRESFILPEQIELQR